MDIYFKLGQAANCQTVKWGTQVISVCNYRSTFDAVVLLFQLRIFAINKTRVTKCRHFMF